MEFGDDDETDYFGVHVLADKHYGTPIFKTVGGETSCPGESGTSKADSKITIASFNYDYCQSDLCLQEPYGSPIVLGVVFRNLSPQGFITDPGRNLNLYRLFGPPVVFDKKTKCGDPGYNGGLSLSHAGIGGLLWSGGYPLKLPYGESEVLLKIDTTWNLPVECLSYSNIPISIFAECEYETNTYQYRTELDEKTKEVSVEYPQWDNETLAWVDETLPHFPFRYVSSPDFENRADSNYQRHFTVGWVSSPTSAPTNAPTASPSVAPTTNFKCAVAIDGFPSKDNFNHCPSFNDIGLDDILIIPKTNATAGVRCCGPTASADVSICPDGSCSGYAFDTASALCEDAGLRLCSSVEILTGRAAETGCKYNHMHVWTADQVPCVGKATIPL